LRIVKKARQKKLQAEDIFAETVINGKPLYDHLDVDDQAKYRLERYRLAVKIKKVNSILQIGLL
jgi:hypothetical protein